MKAKQLLCALLALVMVFSIAACGGNSTGTNSGSTGNANKGVRVDANGKLLYKPEDVGELDNPIVTGFITQPVTEDYLALAVKWKEEAYGFEYKYDSCPWEEREVKLVSAYVSGTAYDVFTDINYPTAILKGLLEPVSDHLPLTDFPEYFKPVSQWGDKYYGATVYPYDRDPEDATVTGVYGIFYNKNIFEDNGEPMPGDLFDEGNWTFEALFNAAKNLTMDTDRDGKTDIWGFDNYVNELYTIGNGAKTVSMTPDSIELTWNSAAYVEGFEWLIKMAPYSTVGNGQKFYNGSAAMFCERLGYGKNIIEADGGFEWDWVPTPKGPSGEGYRGTIGYGGIRSWSIGKDAKNIEGAKVFIASEIALNDYYVPHETAVDSSTYVTQEMFDRAMSCEGKFISDNYGKIGSMGDKMWNVWSSLPETGAKAAIEKYTPVFQKEIDNLLATEKVAEPVEYKTPGLLDFEDGNAVLQAAGDATVTVTEDASEVINGSKSLKVKLAGYGPMAVTTKDNFGIPYGAQMKLTFKAKAVGGTATPEGTLRVSFRPSGSLDDDSMEIGGYNTVDLTDGAVHEVELMFNVLENYNDLQMVLIGGTDESAPDLAVIIDDLTLEKIS